jgi:2'-5' RNA ligase
MRLFVAIELPDATCEHLARVQETLRPDAGKASMTRRAQLHLTLKFLGEVDGKRAEALKESLAKVAGRGAIELFAESVQCFPPRGPVRIVAANLAGQVPALAGVHDAVEQRCRFLGFDRETRAYHPHVTLARARPTLPAPFRERAVEATRDLWPGPTFDVSEIVLVQSTLKPTGSEYVTIARFPLG